MFNDINSSDTDYEGFIVRSASLVKWVNLFRGLIAILACIPNALVIFLYCRAARRQPSIVRTRLNYAVVNLLITNIVYCIVLCVYSFLKLFASYTLHLVSPCLIMTWFTVFASCEPMWAMWLVALCRVVHFARNDRLDRLLSTCRLVLLRCALFLLDACAASVIIVGRENDAVEKHCNYQLMLDNSNKYVAYSFFILICLVVMGAASFVFRFLPRLMLMRQIHAAEHLPNVLPGDPEHARKSIADSDPPPQPSAGWTKPKVIIIAVTVLALFLVPRIAFFLDSRPFWLISTLCPALMALVLPLAFLWTTKEFRSELRILTTRACIKQSGMRAKAEHGLNPFGKK